MRLSFILVVVPVALSWCFLDSRASGLKITPNNTELTFTKGAAFTLICENDRPVDWILPQYDPAYIDTEACNATSFKIFNKTTSNGTQISTLQKENSCYMDTGYYSCYSLAEKSEASIYIFVADENRPLIHADPLVTVDKFGDAIIPCRPTSPDVVPILRISDTREEMIDVSYDPKIGFIKKAPTLGDSANVECEVGDNSEYTRYYQLFIQPKSVRILRPFIDASHIHHAVEGANIILHCKVPVNEGDVLFINWKYPNRDLKELIIDGSQEVKMDEGNVRINSKTIKMTNLTKFHEGEYICEVSDMENNRESVSYNLTVHDENSTFLSLSISDDKLEWTVDAGKPEFQWVVQVKSYPRAGVTWRFDRDMKEIFQGNNNKHRTEFDGRAAKLVINSLHIDDSGSYTIIATNGRETHELKLTLHVNDKPDIKTLHEERLYMKNETYKVHCTISGYPLPQVTWHAKSCNDYPNCGKEPFRVLPSKSYQEIAVYSHLLKSELTIGSNVSLLLRCDASNERGQANATSKFLVTDVAEGFAASASPKVITVDDDITLSCGASKYYYYDSVVWFFNDSKLNQLTPARQIAGVLLSNATSTLSYGVTLRIPHASRNFSGQYVCNAHSINETSTDEVKFVNIYVKDVMPPSWNSTNMNGTTKTKTEKQVTFECQVNGSPTPKITWLKNKMPIRISANDTRVSLLNDNQTLFIQHTALSDEGEYTCVAVNKVGNISASEQLYFLDKPENHSHLLLVILCAIPTIICCTCIACLAGRIQKERKLRKELAETGLLNFEEGAANSLNPALGIEDQADLLPYDRRWEFPREKLTFGKQLGSGAFGVVMKAEADGIIDENTTTTVAVKMVKRGADPLHIRALASELKIMIHLGRHLNVVNLLGACTRNIYKRELVVIVEYCKYGNLHDFLLKQRNNFINQIDDEGQLDFSITDLNNRRNRYSGVVNNSFTTSANTNHTSVGTEMTTLEETPIGSDGYLISKDTEPDWRSNYRGDYRNTIVRPIKTADLICWSFQIARGMEYLASRKVLHGDLAARNVLLADDNIVKICDFGLAKSMYNNDNYQRKRNELLPIRWMAVESIRDRVFSIQSDVWSFGITMWELFSLSVTPYPGVEHLETLYTKLATGYRLEQPSYATKELQGIMVDCWHARPTLRPTFSELSERLGALLEEGVRSHYMNLNEMYLKMNEDMNNQVDYLALLNPPVYTTAEEPRYVNVPTRDSPDLEEDVELKPMLPMAENGCAKVNPTISFSNPSYAPLTRPT